MKIVTKSNKIFATHTDDQDLVGLYGGLQVIHVDDSVNIFDDNGNFISKDELLILIAKTDVECGKECMWSEAKGMRSKRYYDNITTSKGVWQSDTESVCSINSALNTLALDTDIIIWSDIDNLGVQLTKSELADIVAAYDTRRVEVFNASMLVKNDINSCTTVEQLDGLDLESLFDSHI